MRSSGFTSVMRKLVLHDRFFLHFICRLFYMRISCATPTDGCHDYLPAWFLYRDVTRLSAGPDPSVSALVTWSRWSLWSASNLIDIFLIATIALIYWTRDHTSSRLPLSVYINIWIYIFIYMYIHLLFLPVTSAAFTVAVGVTFFSDSCRQRGTVQKNAVMCETGMICSQIYKRWNVLHVF